MRGHPPINTATTTNNNNNQKNYQLERALRSVVIHRGYLYQRLPEDDAMALLKGDWELKYLTLGSGGLLRVFDSDLDEGRVPGALLHLAGCAVEVEPPDADRAWCLRVMERGGGGGGTSGGIVAGGGGSSAGGGAVAVELLVLAADSAAALLQWADAFERAGVKVIWPVSIAAAGVRSSGGGGGGSHIGSRTSSAPLLRELSMPARLGSSGSELAAAAAAASAARQGSSSGGAGAAANGRGGGGSSGSGGDAAKARRAAASPAARLEALLAVEKQQPGLLRQLSMSFALPPLMARSIDPCLLEAAEAPAAAAATAAAAAAAAAAATIAAEAAAASDARRAHRAALARSQRWVREPAGEEFVAYPAGASAALGAVLDETSPFVQAGRRSSGAGMGRSASASGMFFAPDGSSGGGGGGGSGGSGTSSVGPSPLRGRRDGTPPVRLLPKGGGAAGAASAPTIAAAAPAAPGTPPAAPAPPAGGAAAAAGRRVRRVMWGSTAVHRERHESLLTSPATYMERHSGLVTLALVVLAVTHVRWGWWLGVVAGWLGVFIVLGVVVASRNLSCIAP